MASRGRERQPSETTLADAGPAGPLPVAPGDELDHFLLLKHLGRGGMGEVFLARDTRLGRKVAVKVVPPALAGSPQARERFLFEARATARFSHPHIVTIHAVGEHHGTAYVALEYLSGPSLRERLAERRPSLKETLRIGLAIAEALGEAHRHQILHRDLKPENVILPPDGRLRVIDFGLAKRLREPAEDAAPVSGIGFEPELEIAGGTPRYMAPEQWWQRESSGATDVWALGVMLFEMCAGRPPFGDDALVTDPRTDGPSSTLPDDLDTSADAGSRIGRPPLDALVRLRATVCSAEPAPDLARYADVPGDLARLVGRCLAKDARDRPSASEVADGLRAMLRPELGVSGTESPFPGLLSYTERDAALFFGRATEIAAFVERMRTQPILAVVGMSGAGKSSFVQAGVLPRLREQARWVALALRPGSRPFEALAGGLRRREASSLRGEASPPEAEPLPAPDSEAMHALADELRRAPGRLGIELRAIADRQGAQLLLFVDQIEELWTLGAEPDTRRGFLRALCMAADDPLDPVRVVLTLRHDFLGKLAGELDAGEMLAGITVIQPLDRGTLEQALTRPVEALGFRFEDPDLPARMVAAVEGEPASLPLLQFAAQRLWEARDEGRRLLPSAVFDAMGGVEGVLARHADGVLEGMSGEALGVARALLVRLVTDELTRKTLPSVEVLEGLGAEADGVLERLTQARLLTVRGSSDADGVALVELAHESLVHTWGTLRRWIEESHEDLASLHQLKEAAALWDRRGRRREELWQGRALEEALGSARRLGAAVSGSARAFLEESRGRERALERRRSIGRAAVVGGSLLGAAIAIAVAATLADKEQRAVEQKRLAEERGETALLKTAEALREAAHGAYAQERTVEARAKLRASLEIADAPETRALWLAFAEEPLVWHASLPAVVTEVDVSVDERTMAAATMDGTVYLFDARTGEARALRGHTDDALGLMFSPDGAHVATSSLDGSVAVWRLEGGSLVRRFEAHPGGALEVAYSGDGRLVASSGVDGGVRVWDAATGAALGAFAESTPVPTVRFRPGSRELAWTTMDGRVVLADARDPAHRRTLRGHRGTVYRAVFSPDGRSVASGSSDGTVRIWDARTGDAAHVLGHSETVSAIAFASDGRLLATGSWDGRVRIWSVATGALERTLAGHPSTLASLRFLRGDRMLFTASEDRVRLWDLTRRGAETAGAGHSLPVRAVAFSPDGARIASVGGDGALLVWSSAQGTVEQRLTGHRGVIHAVSFSPDGALLASAGADEVRLSEMPSGALVRRLTGHRGVVWDVAFRPGTGEVASAGADGSIYLSRTSGSAIPELVAEETMARSIGFSPDGRFLATAGRVPHALVYDLMAGTSRRLACDSEVLMKIAFGPDGRELAATGLDPVLWRWSLGAREEPRRVVLDARANAVAYHPDGSLLALGGADGRLRLFSRDGSDARVLGAHPDEILGLSFSADGELLASAGEDGSVRLWHVASGRPAWRGTALVAAPPRLLSHAGWTVLAADAPAAAFSLPWSRALERTATERARLVRLTEDGSTACVLTHAGDLELWGSHDEEPRVRRAAVDTVAAVPGGCLGRDARAAHIVTAAGRSIALETERAPVAISFSAGAAWVTAPGHVTGFAPDGARLGARPIGQGAVMATALADPGGRLLLVGFRNGDVELASFPDAEGAPRRLEQTPSSPLTAALAGPMGTALLGFADGAVGIWALGSGKRLGVRRLHGAVVHLMLERTTLYAASELGSWTRWPLDAFYDDYCTLVGRVWSEVPLAWMDGAAAPAAAPADHPCRDPRSRP
jgi:WD40 repeat protein/serine/threonine protein kinase